MGPTIKIGVSSCLLGNNVRYDGGNKLDRNLIDSLGSFVQFVPVCPEVECGLPVPREAMHLEGDPSSPRLVTLDTHVDYTVKMSEWACAKMAGLVEEDLCGFVFKSRSPSCGIKGINVYPDTGCPTDAGAGIFARALMERFPFMPVEDEARLQDPVIREKFIERVFAFKRLKNRT
jgi:uncharacterized protein YbbK (DUF523 family)